MPFSINTNAGAMIALQNLYAVSAELDTVRNRISTGLKVSGPKDNPATYAIAQRMRGDLAGLRAVRGSLDRAEAETDVAIAGGQAVSDLLIQMREKAIAARDPGAGTEERVAYNAEFKQLRDQLASIVSSASFNGRNLLTGHAITAITDKNGSNRITLAAHDFSLGGAEITISAAAQILTESDGANMVTAIDASLRAVNEALSDFGAGAKRIELQRTFVGKLSDSIEIGIGNLVDADLAAESARYYSLQVRQQLAIQALSIANQAPLLILRLFQ